MNHVPPKPNQPSKPAKPDCWRASIIPMAFTESKDSCCAHIFAPLPPVSEKLAKSMAQRFVDFIDHHYQDALTLVNVSFEQYENEGYGLLFVAEFSQSIDWPELLEYATYSWESACHTVATLGRKA